MRHIINNMATPSEDLRIKQLEDGIRLHLLTNDTYHFRPIKIDGINVYIVLYGKYKILNIESIYISCNAKIGDVIEKQQYSLYHYQYKSLRYALKRVEKINREYRIYNGELVPATCYKMLKLEECVLPYSEAESCCVCYENTSDITSCGHSICLNCRETCMARQKMNCPVCRETAALEIYMNRSGLVNNQQYTVVKKAIHNEKMNSVEEDFIPFAQPGIYDEDDEEDGEDEEEDEEEEEEEDGEDEEEQIAEILNDMRVPSEISDIQNDTHEDEIPEPSELHQIFWRISRTPSTVDDEVDNTNVSSSFGFNI